MSSDPLVPLADPEEISACWGKVSAGHEEFVRMVGETFDTLQILVAELEKRQGAWQTDRDRAASNADRRAAELTDERQRMADERMQWRKELRAMRRSIENVVQQLVPIEAGQNHADH